MSSDSDIAVAFKQMHEANREKKLGNLENSTQMLIGNNIKFETKNNGVHLIVREGDAVWDFWPSTGKFTRRGVGYYQRGVRKLISQVLRERRKD